MTSDGVDENVVRHGISLLRKSRDADPRELAQKIGEAAMEKYKDHKRDDISVIIVKVETKSNIQ